MQLQIFPRPLPYVLITVMDEICLVASTATNLFLVHLERVAVLHFELEAICQQFIRQKRGHNSEERSESLRTDSGESVGCTRVPSNRNRTVAGTLP
jgi:hypothetical protein